MKFTLSFTLIFLFIFSLFYQSSAFNLQGETLSEFNSSYTIFFRDSLRKEYRPFQPGNLSLQMAAGELGGITTGLLLGYAGFLLDKKTGNPEK